MKINKKEALLTGLAVIILTIRLYLSIKKSPLLELTAYESLRQIQQITITGLPIINDALITGGRTQAILPLYYYLLSFLSLFFNSEIITRITPNILIATTTIPVYLYSYYITKNHYYSFIAGIFAGISPAMMMAGLADGTPFSLGILLLTAALYWFLIINRSRRAVSWLLITIITLSLSSPLSIIFVTTTMTYFLIAKTQSIKISKREFEVSLFYLFFTTWVMLTLFKKAFITHGLNIIWQNAPKEIISKLFTEITIPQALATTGVIPLIMGLIGLRAATTNNKKRSLNIILAFIITNTTLLLLRIIPLEEGLILITIALSIAASYGLQLTEEYLKKTKIARTTPLIITIITITFIIISLPQIMAIKTNTPTINDQKTLQTARIGIEENNTIITPTEYGYMTQYLAKKPVVINENFILMKKAKEKYEDITKIYDSYFLTDALTLMEKYQAKYLFKPEKTPEPKYINNECFIPIINNSNSIIYEKTCNIRG